MSRIIQVFIDGETDARLRVLAEERGTSIEELAELATAEAALDSFRGRKDDPATLIRMKR